MRLAALALGIVLALAGAEIVLAVRGEPRFLEAVASSSPPVARDLIAGREGARLKRQVASYLQRVCAKNETMSFFGPINYGGVEPTVVDVFTTVEAAVEKAASLCRRN